MGRGNTSTAHVVITMEGQQALNVIESLKKRAQSLRKELMEMEKAGISPDDKDYKEKYNEMKMMERAVNQNKTAYINLDRTVRNLNKTTLRELQRSLKECRKQMQNLSADDPKMKKLIAQYRAIDNQIGQITGQFKRQQGVLEGLVSRLSAYVFVYSGFNFIKGQVADTVKENIALSDSLADIRKVTGMSAEEVNELSKALHGLDTRTTSEGLHELAYEAGKIGLKGVDDVMQFVKAGNQIKVALGEDLGENALVELMKMSEVMGTTKTMGVEKSLLAIGSSINELSASSTASGEDINGFAKRLSGVAAQANITTDQLLGLGSASSAMNMEVEVAATAFNKFINQIVAKTDVVAKAAGIEFEVLDEMIKSGETMEASVLVLEKLGQKGGLRALGPIMGDLGSNGSRLNNVLATFSQNVDLLKTHLNTSSTAFEQATSVTNEYNIKNENAAAIVARMGNAIKETFVNSGITEWITNILRSLYELPKTVEENKGKLIAAIVAITAALTGLDARLAAVNIRFTKMGLLRMLATLKGGITSLIAPLKTVLGLIIANPWTAATATIAIFAGTFIDAAKKVDYMGKAVKRVKKFTDEGSESINKETIRVTQLFEWLKRTKEGTEEYNIAKQTILSNYGQYLKGLDNEITRLQNIEGAYRAIIKAASDAAKMRMSEKALGEAGDAYATNTSGVYKEVYSILKGKQELVETEDLKGNKKTEWVQKYSKEEINNIVSQIRTAIDTGTEVTPEIQAIIDSIPLQLKSSPTNRMGTPKEEWVNPLKDQMTLLRNAKAAYDYELAEIEESFGLSLKDILAGGTNGNNIVPDLNPEVENAKKLASAKKEQQALLAALELFYAQQEQVINQQYLDREITVTEREKRLADVEKRMLQSRIAARRALLNDPEAMEEWSAELQRMSDENIANSDENTAALTALYGKNLHQIGEALRNFGEGEMDGIRKNMEQDRIAIQTNAVQMRQELEQILLENDFTGKVTEQYIRSWEKLGFSMSQYKDEAESFMRDMNTKVYPELFNIDINTDEGLNAFKDLLLETEGYSVELVNLGTDAMRLLYYQAIQYGDDMADATRKARKFGQRVADQRWRMGGGLGREAALDREAEAIDSSTSLFSRVGLASDNVANDLEVELYKKRLQAALDYRDTVIESGGDIEKANEKVAESINNLSNVMIEKTMQQLEVLKSFMDPLEELGDEIGAALGIDDSKEKADALSEAFWGAADELADATKDMITNWVKQKLQHAINKRAIEQQERAHQAQQAAIVSTGMATEQTIVQAGEQAKATAVQQSETQISTTKQAHSAQNISTQATETGADAALGIAQGSAKTIGELGWMGIPLVAVISALIGGLLSWAMGKVKGAGKAVTQTAAPTGKVVSSMLAYDSGNVQQVLAGGRVYSARVGGIDGSGLVTRPTLTNVGGQPALVGELGPELVIGRATTRAMMQDNPRLLSSLIQFDRLHSGRGFRAYDNGNVQSMGGGDGSMEDVLQQMVQTLSSLSRTNDRLNRQLELGLKANIIRKELTEETINALYEEKQKGNNRNLKRLLGVP